TTATCRSPILSTCDRKSREASRISRTSSSIAHGLPWVKGCVGTKKRSTCGVGCVVGSFRNGQPGPDYLHNRTNKESTRHGLAPWQRHQAGWRPRRRPLPCAVSSTAPCPAREGRGALALSSDG